MNDNQTVLYHNGTKDDKTISLLNTLTDVTGIYLITIVSSIGLLINLLMLKILVNKKLKHSFYNYLWTKSFIDVLVCLIGIGYLKSVCINCTNTSQNTYGFIFYHGFIIMINTRVLFMTSAFHEIFLIYNRVIIIANKKSISAHVNLKYYIPMIVIIPILLVFPGYFSFTIAQHASDKTLYFITLTNFGELIYFKIYLLGIFTVESLIPVITLIVLSLVSVRRFRKRMKKKREFISESHDKLSIKENRFYRMTLILTSVFAIVRMIDMTNGIVNRSIFWIKVEMSDTSLAIINFSRQLAFLLMFASHAFSAFIYVPRDENLINFICEMLRLNTDKVTPVKKHARKADDSKLQNSNPSQSLEAVVKIQSDEAFEMKVITKVPETSI